MLSFLPFLTATIGVGADELFEYQRGDGPTVLRLDTNLLADEPLDPRLCGNFLEHLGGVIYDGVWAQCLAAPTFEPLDDRSWGWFQREPWVAFLDRQTPFPWQVEGELTVTAAPDATVNQQSLRLAAGGAGALVQRNTLPLHRTGEYRGSVYLRAEGPSRLRLAVRRPDGEELGAVDLRAGKAWRRVEFALSLARPDGVGNDVQVRLELDGPGAVELDNLELFPTDAVDGMDPDIIRLSREWRMPILRYPGGNFVSGYHWRDGVGPHDQRRTMPNPAWAGIEYNTFGTDEFMRFCELIGTAPMICVNIGNGTPEEAAAWVEYCNGSTATPMGALRAANGHPEPYNVRLWEVGNEIYGSWQIGHCDAAENLRRYNAFSAAMLAADPTIELIACGNHRDDRWQETLLHGAVPLTSISEHPLVHPGHMPRDETLAQMWPRIAAHPWWYWRDYLPHLRDLAAQAHRPGIEIAVTEWGIIAGGDDRNLFELPHAQNQAGAVYAGCLLNALLRRHDMVKVANITGLLHGGGLRRWGKVAYGDPQYYVSRLWVDAMGGRLIRLEQSGPGYDADSRNGLPAVADTPWLDAAAVLAADGRTIHLFMVNRSLTESITPAVELPGWRAARGWRVDSGGDPVRRNSPAEPRAVADEPLSEAELAALTCPPLSVTRVDYARDGG